MGLFSFSLILVPFILALAFFAGRQDHGWLVIGRHSLVYVWIAALLLVLGVLFLPTDPLMNGSVSPLPKPFDVLYAVLIYMIPFLALILATLLLYHGLKLIKQKPAPGGENGAGGNLTPRRAGWMASAS